MILFQKAAEIERFLKPYQHSSKTIGFVPTMGALHEGHLSLLHLSKEQCYITVCSIFINPTQFNDPKDFEQYPKTLTNDLQLLIQHQADVLFLPSVEEMYPQGFQATSYDLGYLEEVLEGKFRPGHFQGVCQVIERFLNILQPQFIFMGQKDFQQCKVVQKLIELKHLPVKMITGKTLREKDGLAMSSRNLRLSPEARRKATALYTTLLFIKEQLPYEPIFTRLKEDATERLLKQGFEKVDYVEILNAETFQPATIYNKQVPLIALAAAYIDGVRLIDNMPLTDY